MLGKFPSFIRKLLSWLILLRLGATARGVLPFLLGAVIAWSQGYAIDWSVLLLSAAAVICVMLMTFLVNEYTDYEADIANKDYHSLSGGSRVLAMGLIPRRHPLIAAYVITILTMGLGLWLYLGFKTGPLTIPLGALAIFIGYAYTGRPFRLSYRGWGEISIWFACGWLATMMGYYLQTGKIDSIATLASLPGAFSVFLVILINEVPDITSDRLYGKNNLAVRLGREKAGTLYLIFLAVSYLSIIVIAFFGVPAPSAYLSVLLLPFIAWIVYTIRKRGLGEKKVQESLSVRTMVYDHLITVIYAAGFAIEGLRVTGFNAVQLLLLGTAFAAVFMMEGVGILSTKAIAPGEVIADQETRG